MSHYFQDVPEAPRHKIIVKTPTLSLREQENQRKNKDILHSIGKTNQKEHERVYNILKGPLGKYTSTSVAKSLPTAPTTQKRTGGKRKSKKNKKQNRRTRKQKK
jgi:hypothetical protein